MGTHPHVSYSVECVPMWREFLVCIVGGAQRRCDVVRNVHPLPRQHSFVVLISWTCVSDGTPFNSALLLAPWMTTTLYYFYGLVLFLWAYVLMVESTWLAGLGWCAAFACGGSAGMWAFVSIRLWRAQVGDSLFSVFLTQA